MNREAIMKGQEQREAFNIFISKLRGHGFGKKIADNYPNAVLVIDESAELPKVKECQKWSCQCGCGGSEPIFVPHPTMSVVGPEGLIEVNIEGIWVSPCVQGGCDIEDGLRFHGMDLWDYSLDDFVTPAVTLEGN